MLVEIRLQGFIFYYYLPLGNTILMHNTVEPLYKGHWA